MLVVEVVVEEVQLPLWLVRGRDRRECKPIFGEILITKPAPSEESGEDQAFAMSPVKRSVQAKRRRSASASAKSMSALPPLTGSTGKLQVRGTQARQGTAAAAGAKRAELSKLHLARPMAASGDDKLGARTTSAHSQFKHSTLKIRDKEQHNMIHAMDIINPKLQTPQLLNSTSSTLSSRIPTV